MTFPSHIPYPLLWGCMLPRQSGELIEAEVVSSLLSLICIEISASPKYNPNNYNSSSPKKRLASTRRDIQSTQQKNPAQAQEPKRASSLTAHVMITHLPPTPFVRYTVEEQSSSPWCGLYDGGKDIDIYNVRSRIFSCTCTAKFESNQKRAK